MNDKYSIYNKQGRRESVRSGDIPSVKLRGKNSVFSVVKTERNERLKDGLIDGNEINK